MYQFVKAELSPELKNKISSCVPAFEQLPGVVIVHDLVERRMVYVSPRGLKLLNITMDEISAMTHEEYHNKHFNDEDARDYAPKILGLLERNNDDELLTFFQQVRYAGSADWMWHLSGIKIFHRDTAGNPLLAISIGLPIDAMHHIAAKAERLLNENNFLRKNYKNFSQLTSREKDVLRLTALGKSAAEIAVELFIAETTAETHRRNLKNKLQVNTYFELSQYAIAFDLI